LWFRQEGHSELKCYSAKSLVPKYDGVVDSHATSNLASDEKMEKPILFLLSSCFLKVDSCSCLARM